MARATSKKFRRVTSVKQKMQSKNAKQKCEARMQSKNKNESFEFARHVEADQIKNFLLAVTETLDMALYVYNLPRRAPSKTRRRSLKQIFYEYRTR